MNPITGVYIILAGLLISAIGYGIFELWTGRKRLAHLARVAAAAEITSAAVLVLAHDAVIEWANEALTKVTGFAVDDAIGKTPAALLLGSALNPKLIQQFRDGLSSGQSFS